MPDWNVSVLPLPFMSESSPPLCRLEQIPPQGFLEVQAELDGAVESLLLYRDGERVHGWFNLCPHAGRRLDWAPGQFLKTAEGLLVCAAHGAGFDPASGLCVSGPCRGDSLRAVALSVDAEHIALAAALDA